jgi:hypothetical protein
MIDDKGGEDVSIESLLICSASALSAQNRWDRNQISVAPVSVFLSQSQYLFCQASSVAPSFQNRWHRFWMQQTHVINSL